MRKMWLEKVLHIFSMNPGFLLLYASSSLDARSPLVEKGFHTSTNVPLEENCPIEN